MEKLTVTRTFVGIGFGPIQSGLFLLEAYQSNNFTRLVVAEVATDIVNAVRQSNGRYSVNVAETESVRLSEAQGLEIYNSQVSSDRASLISAIAEADEIATALPSIEFYGQGTPSPAHLLADGFLKRLERRDERMTVVYAAENHNQAAEQMRIQVRAALPEVMHEALNEQVQFVNTVIGKMSGVVNDRDQMLASGLQPLVQNGEQAILVEQFNRILIERIRLPGFRRGLDVFEEKLDLLPFEEAKLYGHNAAHALMGFLAHRQGFEFMSEARGGKLFDFVKDAFLEESGGALCQRHQGVDPLFTATGWESYVDDLLLRMTNVCLQDQVQRVIRDIHRNSVGRIG